MKRIGIIDFDTSHVSAFVSRLNHVGIAEDQWVDGARIVAGCPGTSLLDPKRIGPETESVRKLGLKLVESPEDLRRMELDAVFIESNSGLQHLDRVKFFLPMKTPLFVDKPFACSLADAQEMFALADKAGVPIMSCSSLRYAAEVIAFQNGPLARDPKVGVFTYGPAPTHEKNPGLFNYGIHAVEMLFAMLGTGCEWLCNVASDDAEEATGRWKNGRIGSVRGLRPYSDFGFVTFSKGKGTHHSVDLKFAYRDMLRQIVRMIETGKSPIPPAETLQIVQFIEEAQISAEIGRAHV